MQASTNLATDHSICILRHHCDSISCFGRLGDSGQDVEFAKLVDRTGSSSKAFEVVKEEEIQSVCLLTSCSTVVPLFDGTSRLCKLGGLRLRG